MATIQEMCARIGVVTEKGLAGNLKSYFKSKILLYFLAALIIIANTINIGAENEEKFEEINEKLLKKVVING